MADQNVDGFIELASEIRKKFDNKKSIWCYSGYTYEYLSDRSKQKSLISYLDVLVDGPFILKHRNISLKFRGSENQRLVDIKETEKLGRLIQKI